ncbi:MAG: tandem-95 repeat protein, partial [Pseudomonadota bacterium]
GSAPLFTSGIEVFRFDDGSELTRTEMAARARIESAGNDLVQSGPGGGFLDGGAGDDTLKGGVGDDVFRLARATGDDLLRDAGGTDTLLLGQDIAPGALALSRTGAEGQDLLVEIGGQTRSAVTIEDQFATSGPVIEEIRYSDDTALSWVEIQAQLLRQGATPGADMLRDFPGTDIIAVRGGDDAVVLSTGNDVVYGGDGRDEVRLGGTAADYEITEAGNRLRVADKSGSFGTKTLVDVERVVFTGDPAQTPLVVWPDAAPLAREAAFATAEDRALTLRAADLLDYAEDPEGEALTLLSVGAAENATVTRDGDLVRVVPDADFAGTAAFAFTVTDAGGQTATARAEVAVTPVNDAPRATGISFGVQEDTPLTLSMADVLGVATDPEGAALTLAGVGAPEGGTLARQGETVVFTPAPDFSGSAGFEATVADAEGAAAAIRVAVEVAPVNDAPIVRDLGTARLAAGETLTLGTDFLTVTASDPEGEMLRFAGLDGATGGSLSCTGDSIVFTPEPGFVGEGGFGYRITDAQGAEALGRIALDIQAETDPRAPVGPEVFTGTPEEDRFEFADWEGARTVDGLTGTDSVVLATDLDGLRITGRPGGFSLEIAGGDPIAIENIERLELDDATLVLSQDPDTAALASFYQIAFGRMSDIAGLSFWQGVHDSGVSLARIAQVFAESGEFVDTHGAGFSDRAYVELAYTNGLGRSADAAGSDWWTAQLASASLDRGEVLEAFALSEELNTRLTEEIDDGLFLLA